MAEACDILIVGGKGRGDTLDWPPDPFAPDDQAVLDLGLVGAAGGHIGSKTAGVRQACGDDSALVTRVSLLLRASSVSPWEQTLPVQAACRPVAAAS